jgi:AAA domain/Winged helix-turn-helix DNA-binding
MSIDEPLSKSERWRPKPEREPDFEPDIGPWWERPEGPDLGEPPPMFEDAQPEPALVRIWGIAEFLARYEPISYTIDGLLPGGVIYGVTARRGVGKTAFLTSTALAVATGRSYRSDILGLDVEKGRVAYIILENPTDFLMKLSVTAFARGIDVRSLNEKIRIIDMRRPHEVIMSALRNDADRLGPFQLVCYDTFQAGFAGANFNDNNDTLKHAADLRTFTTLSGKPSVLVACHPVKNATRDNLEPYGGGATMNEFDGNLTLWSAGGVIELHHNKVRGPEFEPMHFRIDKLGSPDILDNKGRQPQLPILYRMSEEEVERREKVAEDNQTKILKALLETPGASIRELVKTTGVSKSSVERQLKRLAIDKLVAQIGGKWTPTKAGIKAASC